MIRTRTVKAGMWPVVAERLIEVYREHSQSSCQFEIPGLPPTVNHQYKHTRFNTRLTDAAHAFRTQVLASMGPLRWTWRPKGVTAGLVILESPLWLTKKRTIREMDCDNRLKPIFDAIKQATGVDDQSHWAIHAFKLASDREKTLVFLFDLGDVIDFTITNEHIK